jgi:hypothetical protein
VVENTCPVGGTAEGAQVWVPTTKSSSRHCPRRAVIRHIHRGRYRREAVTYASAPGSSPRRLDTAWPLAAGVRADRSYRELRARCAAPGWTGARLGSHEAALLAK